VELAGSPSSRTRAPGFVLNDRPVMIQKVFIEAAHDEAAGNKS
jgi:hypothetical protein